jgi:glycerol-3-phosphate acyltransferase PlsY
MTAAQGELIGLIPAAYLVGSIPFGLIVGRSRGVDPRKAGSGNIGATNVGRLLGGKYFALVFALDLLKGMIPTLAAGAIQRFSAGDAGAYALWLSVGFAAILGHMFSVFLHFKGGKGVATSTGVMLGVFPYYTLAGIAGTLAFFIVFKICRYVSLASICGAFGFSIGYVALGIALHWDIAGKQLPLLIFAVLVSVLILIKHRTNLARLRAGTEHRIGKKQLAAGSPSDHASGAGNGSTASAEADPT